jgi:hypothetical protein
MSVLLLSSRIFFFLSLQPCYQASAPSVKLLRDSASLREVVHALNNFYEEFLEGNIRLNLDHANQEDINDGEINKQNVTKVLKMTLMI